ncbi:glycosyltransferase family 22 protein [Baudoinia panamericana UAMH 10762]|uniref:Mannosyltransferase n=1 Tax=Baudoinia panamericana (strain UAMH 10762) TaxID=717646 RepID=M2LT06_BAUPA|nr:glycosyltransferase family 22 protein [Baudoinia panamericana UAMH 10762]EMC97642.1 glycosyltransferase family 22 protein [Baudoinia panamericana UAMH 10762]
MAVKDNAIAKPDISFKLEVAILLALFSLRVINALSVQTFFQPDEYFQSLEPAWRIAFGEQSGAWITWEWREQLRSSLHPMLFAAAYRTADGLAKQFRVDHDARTALLLAAPKILQAVIAAAGDFFTWQIARRLYGSQSRTSFAALALTVFSPWQFFCSVRTFSNSSEAALTAVALAYWPWHWFLQPSEGHLNSVKKTPSKRDVDAEAKEMVQQFKSFLEHGDSVRSNGATKDDSKDVAALPASPPGLYLSLTAAALACILRPTNLIIWATISVSLLVRYGTPQKAVTLAQGGLLCGSAVFIASLGVDRTYYGEWTFPPLNFIYFNVVQAIAGFYGRNRIDYYFTEGLPLLLTTALPFALSGLWESLRPGLDKPGFRGYEERQARLIMAFAVLSTVVAFTLLAHKEVRFVYPLLPILHVLAARPMAAFFDPFPLPRSKVKIGVLALMLTFNVYIAAYASFVHQRGVIDVTDFLRQEQERRLAHSISLSTPSNLTVGFFMPCHSTPWRSHLIRPETKGWALTCEPPLNLSTEERATYEDEADIFYNHPASWIEDNMKDRKSIMRNASPNPASTPSDGTRREWPEYLAFFEHLEPVMNSVLGPTRYEECWRGFNTHWHDDWRRQGDVVVWCMREP